jgi:hypothetical protein
MGRRRNHDGDSGLASDQIPGAEPKQHPYQALLLSTVSPPGLSRRYTPFNLLYCQANSKTAIKVLQGTRRLLVGS